MWVNFKTNLIDNDPGTIDVLAAPTPFWWTLCDNFRQCTCFEGKLIFLKRKVQGGRARERLQHEVKQVYFESELSCRSSTLVKATCENNFKENKNRIGSVWAWRHEWHNLRFPTQKVTWRYRYYLPNLPSYLIYSYWRCPLLAPKLLGIYFYNHSVILRPQSSAPFTDYSVSIKYSVSNKPIYNCQQF